MSDRRPPVLFDLDAVIRGLTIGVVALLVLAAAGRFGGPAEPRPKPVPEPPAACPCECHRSPTPAPSPRTPVLPHLPNPQGELTT